MNQQLPDKALELFRQAIAADSALAVPHLNAGIALLSSQTLAQARTELERAAKLAPRNPRVWYNLGLLDRAESNLEAAQRDFAKVTEIDPESADAFYFLASTSAARGDYLHAITEFNEAIRLSPMHASAQFGLARALQRTGNTSEARNHLQLFKHITDEKLSSPLGQNYGNQGSYGVAQEIKPEPARAPAMIPLSFSAERLNSADNVAIAAGAFSNVQARGGMCLIETIPGKETDLIVLNDQDNVPGFYRVQANGSFVKQVAPQRGLVVSGSAVACAVGDFDNDGFPDLAITTNNQLKLFRNRQDGTFVDVTEKSGLKDLNRPAGLTFLDIDHDGDLDLFVTGSSRSDQEGSGRNVLWRNNGNQTFTEWTTKTGLNGQESTSTAVLSDINNDRAVDVITAGDDGVVLYLNQREGEFRRVSLYPKHELPPAIGVAIFDFNKDGWMDIAVTHKGRPGITLWQNVDGRSFRRVNLGSSDFKYGWGITPVDFDNDGWIDLAAVVEGTSGTEVHIFRNTGAQHFEDVSSRVGLDRVAINEARSVLATDDDGSVDLLVSRVQGPPILLRNKGGNRNHSVQILLHGLADNKSALGTKVEVFADGLWQKWEIAGATGYLSQGAPAILVGLGSATQIDIVRMLWPTGVPQDEIQPEAKQRVEFTELDRRGSSCPVLFAWNGKTYEFITDTIGAAVVGHWIAPHTQNTPDPDEWIKVPGSQLSAFQNRLSLRFGEPMEEVNYLDNVRLMAIDHPVGTEVFPNERFMADPPFAQAKTILTRSARPPLAAWDDNGREVTNLIRERDRKYLNNFALLPFAGFTNLHSLTLDLGKWSAVRPLRLLMTGYIEYFTATSLYAASQAGIPAISPYVEAQLPDGSWKKVIPDMGFPAGLSRTMVADLTGRIPPETRQIRITTNLQIYWDQILVANDTDDSGLLHETEAPLVSASLAFRGYPQQIEGASPGDLSYNYNSVSSSGPFIPHRGAYTRYGEVTELLKAVDDRYVIFGSGEDIDLEFDSSTLPSLPKGWKRDYFFYANGFVKDMDYYEAMPFTVSSIPFHDMGGYPYSAGEHFPDTEQSLAYQMEWNTRTESDRPSSRYRFEYGARIAQPEIR